MAVDPAYVQGILKAARRSGVPADLSLAIALEESGGNPRAVGDQGSSFGAYQLHRGGALGSMSPAAAFDPYANAMAVLPAWAKIGGGRGLDPKSALHQYYHGVGRGASDEIPTTNALARLGEARQLVRQYGGPGAAGAGAASLAGGGAGPDLVSQALGSGGAPFSLSPKLMGTLTKYLARSQKQALAGHVGSLKDVMKIADEVLSTLPSGTPATTALGGAGWGGSPGGGRPGGAPIKVGGYDFPTAQQGKIIGTPFSGTHTLGNWQSDRAWDIAVPVGTPIYAVEGGVIGSRFGALNSSSPRMAGLRLNLQSPDNAFYYAHMSRFAPGIAPGVRVQPGQLLGFSGSANGVAHLHFAAERGNPLGLPGV